ncbi:MAG: DUF4198 domain-containing protein [Rhodobacteraceae bacterium]|nr:DUF4198 domain-containing protein [Paracoccaceae bacterium]
MSRIFSIVKPILTLAFLASALGAQAHEFWIQPHKYWLDNGSRLLADVRVGMDFGGNQLAFIPSTINAFNITDADGTRKIEGRIGDIPSVNIYTNTDGLQILNLFSTSSMLTWDEFQKFDEFVNLHGMGWVLARHHERGLPETGFKEAYTRFVKSLVAVGDGAGEDRFTGMFFELVAGKNPYTDDMSDGMPITIMFRGQPLPNKQVDLFFRNTAGELTRLSVQSDANGVAIAPNLGAGEYMVNVVHMIEPSAEDQERTGVSWHSLWGSLTFAIGA